MQWESSNVSNVYRVGHKGKVDLKCDTPGDGGEYYPDHLPMSGGFVVLCNVNHTHMYNRACRYNAESIYIYIYIYIYIGA